jgi:hypothetical protein
MDPAPYPRRRDVRSGCVASLQSAAPDCGELAGPLFVGTFLIEGARRPSYRPRSHPVSALALGESGWTQTTNFLATGALTCAFAAGPGSTWIPSLILTVGCCLLGVGVIATDPYSSYPPGTPARTSKPTRSRLLHNLWSVPILLGLPAACFTYCRRCAADHEWAWAGDSAASGVNLGGNFSLASAGFNQAPQLVDNAGPFQRAAIITGFGWMSMLAARLRHRSTRPSAALSPHGTRWHPPTSTRTKGRRARSSSHGPGLGRAILH